MAGELLPAHWKSRSAVRSRAGRRRLVLLSFDRALLFPHRRPGRRASVGPRFIKSTSETVVRSSAATRAGEHGLSSPSLVVKRTKLLGVRSRHDYLINLRSMG